MQHRESGAQLLTEALYGGTRGGLVSALDQPEAFPGGEHEVGINLPGNSLQTVPRGVGDHEHRPL